MTTLVNGDIIRTIMTPKRFLKNDRTLSEAERAGLEEYLRRKWVSTFDLESPEAVSRFRPGILQDRPEVRKALFSQRKRP